MLPHQRHGSVSCWTVALSLVLVISLAPSTPAQIILGDVTAGGDGTGNAPVENTGIDPRDGHFTTVADGLPNGIAPGALNPAPVDNSDFVDSVFFVATETQAVTQSGVTFDFPTVDAIGTGWNYVFANANAGEGTLPMMVGGLQMDNGVGIHSSTGVTYDLEVMRDVHGAGAVGCFSTFWGTDGGGNVNLYAILSNDTDGVLDSRTVNAMAGSGDYLQVEIPDEATYLTLVTGSNGADGADHGGFGLATITDVCEDLPIVDIAVAPDVAVLAPGALLQLTVSGTNDLGFSTDVTLGATGTTYSVDPEGIVTVDADGLVTGVAIGEAVVTATNNGLDATATITVEALASLALAPASLAATPGKSLQLTVTGTTESGVALNMTAAAAGTTYSADPAGIVTVTEDGLLTTDAGGTTVVTAANSGLTATTEVAVLGDIIDLGNITAGGNGTGAVPEGNIGINAGSGIFAQVRTNANVLDTSGFNPQPVDGTGGASDSPFIDSVFLLLADTGQPINSAGVTFDFAIGDSNPNGWENLLNGMEPGGPDYLAMGPAGVFYNGVGVHASQGITFDLDAIRAEHGADQVKYLWAIAGEASGQATGSVDAYMILSDGGDVLDSVSVMNATDRGELVQLEISDDVQFATLATGAAGNAIGSDHGAFAVAQISAAPFDETSLSSLEVSPLLARLSVGLDVQLTLKGNSGVPGFSGLVLDVDPADAAFASSDTGVASVSAEGLVTAEGSGEATITATVSGKSAQVLVLVDVPALELGDVAAGGDGTGNAPPENHGVNPVDGLFQLDDGPGGIQEPVFGGDGNPSPVLDSDYIDAVFLIGPTGTPPGEPEPELFSQEITMTGVPFDFPGVDAIGTGWNYILKDANGGGGGVPVTVGGYDYSRGVGIHSAEGITYDLTALRDTHGADRVQKFVTVWGMDNGPGDVNLYAILSNDDDDILEAETFHALQGDGELVEMDIPETATYLTLVTGSNGADGSDHGTFAEAIILGSGGGPTGPLFQRGDADANGGINITDGIFVLNYLFLGGATPPCLEAANADDSADLNITDGIYILNFLFLGGPAPVDPGPPEDNCGPDPEGSPSDLGCESYDPCSV